MSRVSRRCRSNKTTFIILLWEGRTWCAPDVCMNWRGCPLPLIHLSQLWHLPASFVQRNLTRKLFNVQLSICGPCCQKYLLGGTSFTAIMQKMILHNPGLSTHTQTHRNIMSKRGVRANCVRSCRRGNMCPCCSTYVPVASGLILWWCEELAGASCSRLARPLV